MSGYIRYGAGDVRGSCLAVSLFSLISIACASAGVVVWRAMKKTKRCVVALLIRRYVKIMRTIDR